LSSTDDEPLGASFIQDGGQREISLLSRGDRVRLLLSPSASSPAPLVLLAGPDGSAQSDWGDGVRASLDPAWVVASIDLPLCGARHSDKLSATAFDPGDPLAQRIRADLEEQVAVDLERALRVLGSRDDIDVTRVAFFASGRGAELSLGFCARRPALRGIALATDAPTKARSLVGAQESALVLDAADTSANALGAVVDFLRERL
jgi:hypothetical protein